MMCNTFNEKCKSGKPVLGIQLRSRSAMIAELYALCGFDFIFIENEHFTYNSETVAALIQVCDGLGIDSMVRIPKNDQGIILQMLDAGASGLFIPHVDTVEDAKYVVDCGKYKPAGNRGFSDGARATNYGIFDKTVYFETANKTTALAPFIESKTAVDDLNAILASGIDAIHIGPGDLAQSCGVDIASAENEATIARIIKTANSYRIPVGMPARTMERASYLINLGCNFISLSSEMNILKDFCQDFVGKFRKKYG
jgi:2-dehydro-3-deoxyglucarate aldolase/4-hydroxy-2-oxoheptanedioate aldolase